MFHPFEGVSEFSYDARGKLTEEQYSYTDDGTPDIRFLTSAQISNKRQISLRTRERVQ